VDTKCEARTCQTRPGKDRGTKIAGLHDTGRRLPEAGWRRVLALWGYAGTPPFFGHEDAIAELQEGIHRYPQSCLRCVGRRPTILHTCASFDRNLTATGCLPLSLCVPLVIQILDKSAVLSLPVPHCPSLSVKENDYESEGRRFESCRAPK
jgi:hypothetical protein